MAMASWMLRRSNLRSGRYNRSHQENEEDIVKLDLKQNAHELAKEILEQLGKPTNLTDAKRLNYLNAFVKLTLHVNRNLSKLGFTIEEILHCLKVSLVLESTIVRSGALRAIRHVLTVEQHIICFNRLLIPFLLSRSLDLAMKNDVERIESMKLIRKVMLLSPQHFEMALAKSLVSLANGGFEEKDRMLRVCLAALSELGVLNAEMFIIAGGVAAITRNLLECQTPKIAESLCGVLLLLLDRPITRNHAAIDLHCVAAPYCDFHYRHGWMDKNRDERELRFNCSRLALLSILRSWPGILHFCSPKDISGLKAIVDVLYLNQLEVRKAVLDLLYELLNLPQPEWTDELSVALSAVDPAEPQAAWRLSEGFVAAEGRSVLPHLARTVPSIGDMHLALLLQCFLETGLLDALSTVIATSDTFISVRATVLLGELLRLIQILLPPDCCNITPAMPSLIEYAATNKPQALRAVTALQQLHKLLKRRPASNSLYLDYILQSGSLVKKSHKMEHSRKYRGSHSKSRLSQLVMKDGDDEIKDSGVLLNKDAYTWNWNIIKVILRGETTFTLDLTDTTHRTFLRHLVDFYTPSLTRYSHMDLAAAVATPKNPQSYTVAGVELIACLLRLGGGGGGNTGSSGNSGSSDPHCLKLIYGLFADVASQVVAITAGKSAHDCLFSPQHMGNTQCQSYFLFIGRLGATQAGVGILKDLQLYKKLEQLATTTNHDCYVKLIVSCFDYQLPSPSRDLLSAILRDSVAESSRLYATQFLLVLLRANAGSSSSTAPITSSTATPPPPPPPPQSTLPHSFSSNMFHPWLLRQLAGQLTDKSRTVRLSALATLHEACEDRTCLEQLVTLRPDLVALGERGVLLLIRMASVPRGFQVLGERGFLMNEVRRWDEYFNYRYVFLVEGETADALTLHQKGEDGRYDKRTSSLRSTSKKDLYLPPHIYGQLAKHSDGFQLLMEHGSTNNLIKCLYNGHCETEKDILKLKSSIWALAHLGSTIQGFEHLRNKYIFTRIVSMAETSVVYSVRATAFYSLGLVATTKLGADHLFKLGWVCTRHDRHERWPIIEEENWEEVNVVDDQLLTGSDSEHTPSDHAFASEIYIPDADSSTTTEDDLLLINFPGCASTSSQPKSSTLPMNQSATSAQHKRSMSESKTFEFLRPDTRSSTSRSDWSRTGEVTHRCRDNSITESTTSGVSSCESVLGKSIINEKVQTLSPIPSNSSLNTLKNPKLRRHSESSRRVSTQSVTPSDKSTISPVGSSTGKLSYQDRVGYATIRLMKRPVLQSFDDMDHDGDAEQFMPFSRVHSLDRNAKHFTRDSGLYSNYLLDGNVSMASLSRIKNPTFNNSPKKRGQCYMGICLPLSLSSLFPDCQITARRLSFSDKNIFYAYSESSSESSLVTPHTCTDAIRRRSRFPKHNPVTCMKCSLIRENLQSPIINNPESTNNNHRDSIPPTHTSHQPSHPSTISKLTTASSEISTALKHEILKHVERLGNPILVRAARQALLTHKQQHGHAFQDACLYSDVCVMLAEHAFRLAPRKFLHELFLDVRYEGFAVRVQRLWERRLRDVRVTGQEEEDRTTEVAGAQGDGGVMTTTLVVQKQRYPDVATEERRSELAPKAVPSTPPITSAFKTKKKKPPVKGFTIATTVAGPELTSTTTSVAASSQEDVNTSNNTNVGVAVGNTTATTNHTTASGNVGGMVAGDHQRFSPTRFEPRSPPLTSVQEETLTSTENLLNETVPRRDLARNSMTSSQGESNRTRSPTLTDSNRTSTADEDNKTEEQRRNSGSSNVVIKTLDSLKLICNENKFPIKSREDGGGGVTANVNKSAVVKSPSSDNNRQMV